MFLWLKKQEAKAAGASSAVAAPPHSKRKISACCNAGVRREKCTACQRDVSKAARIDALPGSAPRARPSSYAAGAGSSGHSQSGGGGQAQYRGPCCGGTRVWGDGKGYDDGHGGRVWRCGNSSCRKLLPRGPAAAPAPSVPLNAEQARAVRLASAGHSFFLTGGAGTGKSFSLSHVVEALRARHGPRAVFITGSTGIAACHVGGTTLHSFAGIGLGKEPALELANRVTANQYASRRWLGERCPAIAADLSAPPRAAAPPCSA